jgi:hypothetical protein
MQFWARPSTVAASTLVNDGGQHAVKLDANGNFVMQYGTQTVVSSETASPNTWYHLMLVRPSAASGSRLYVNGEAVAAAGGGYTGCTPGPNVFCQPLGVGATVTQSGFGFSSADHFNGIIDDLELFVLGFNAADNYGQFDLATDNDYVAAFAPSNPLDLTDDNNLTMADVDAFVDGWLSSKTVNGIRVGDLETRMVGDFNYDGIVDLRDWALLNNASPALGAAALAGIRGVPEPAGWLLAITLLVWIGSRRM